MIDLNKIRSIKTLESIKKDLTDFIAVDRTVMVEVYDEEHGWGEEDYEADLEQVKELLESTERRIKSLSHHLNKQKVKDSSAKAGKNDTQQSGGTEPQSASQPA